MANTSGYSSFGNHLFRVSFETSGRGSFEMRADSTNPDIALFERHEADEYLTTVRMVIKAGVPFEAQIRRYPEVR